MHSNDEDSEKESFFKKNLYDKILQKFHKELSKSIRDTEDTLPKKVNYMDPIWTKFLSKAESLRESIFDARYYAQQYIPNYFENENYMETIWDIYKNSYQKCNIF